MAKDYDSISEKLARFIREQRIFFVATSVDGDEVNLSPKGVAPLRVIDEKTVVYADYHGSGNKTAEHLRAGSRATLMFTSFDEEPLIVRLFCEGEILRKGGAEFNEVANEHYEEFDRSKFRQIFRFHVRRVQRSCGYGTPVMEYVSDRSSKKYFRELLGE